MPREKTKRRNEQPSNRVREEFERARKAVCDFLDQTNDDGQSLGCRLRNDSFALYVDALATDCFTAEDRATAINDLLNQTSDIASFYAAIEVAEGLCILGETVVSTAFRENLGMKRFGYETVKGILKKQEKLRGKIASQARWTKRTD